MDAVPGRPYALCSWRRNGVAMRLSCIAAAAPVTFPGPFGEDAEEVVVCITVIVLTNSDAEAASISVHTALKALMTFRK